MGDNRTIHLATKQGTQSLNIDLEQDFDFLEILSLRITQQEAYRIFCANYGVLVGKVKANGGYPISNAKLSIFIPLDDLDSRNEVVKNVYPFFTPTNTLPTGQRYNLLPRDQQLATPADHTPVGTFPSKYDVMTDDTLLYIHEKYYKYTTTTNENGDYMFFGLPVGTQIVHMDVDLSDIGNNSVTPADLMNLGYAESLFESDQKFKRSNDLDQLAQIVGQNKTIYIRPFWGDVDECEYGITRTDFDTSRFVFPKAYLIGNVYTDAPPSENNSFVPKSCWQESSAFASSGVGVKGGVSRIVKVESLRSPEDVSSSPGETVGGAGIIEACRLTPNGSTEYVGKWKTKVDGSFMIPLPLNLGKKIWDEDSQSWEDDEDEGFATFADYRIKIYFEGQGDGGGEIGGVQNSYDVEMSKTEVVLGSGGRDQGWSQGGWNGSYTLHDTWSSLAQGGPGGDAYGIWYGTFYTNKNKDQSKVNRGVLYLPNPYININTSGNEEANAYTFFAEPETLNTGSAPFNMKDQFGNQLGRWRNYTRVRLSGYYTVAQYFNYVSDYDVAVPGRMPESCNSAGVTGSWYNGPGDPVYSTIGDIMKYGETGPDWNAMSVGTNPWIISRSFVDANDDNLRQFPVNYIFNEYRRKDPRWQAIHLEGDEIYMKNYGGFISNYTTASLSVYSAFNMGGRGDTYQNGRGNTNCVYDPGSGLHYGLRGNPRQKGQYCDMGLACCKPVQLLRCGSVCPTPYNACGTFSDCYLEDAIDPLNGYIWKDITNFYHIDMDGASGNGNSLSFNSTIGEWESTSSLDGCKGCMDLDTIWEDKAYWGAPGRGASIFNEDATPYSWATTPGQSPVYDPNQGVNINGTMTYGNMRDVPLTGTDGANKVRMVGDGTNGENEGIMGNTMCGGFIAPVWGRYTFKARIPYAGSSVSNAAFAGIHYCDTTRKNCDDNANWSYSAATTQFFSTEYSRKHTAWAGFAGNNDAGRTVAYSSDYCPSFIGSAEVSSHCLLLEKNKSICGDSDPTCNALGAYHNEPDGGGYCGWTLSLKEGMAVRLGVQPTGASTWGSSGPTFWDTAVIAANCSVIDGCSISVVTIGFDRYFCETATQYGCGNKILNFMVTDFKPLSGNGTVGSAEGMQNYERKISEPIHGSLYFPPYYVGVNDDECCSRSNGDFEGFTNNIPEERHKVAIWENFSLIFAGSYTEIDGTLNYENYTGGNQDPLGGSPIRNGKYYNVRTIGQTDIIELTKDTPNFRLGPNQWANLDMELPNTSANLSSDYDYNLVLDKSDYGDFFTDKDNLNYPLTKAGGMEFLQKKNFAPYDWLDFRLAQQYPPQFETNQVILESICSQGNINQYWDWMTGNNWGVGTAVLLYPVQPSYIGTTNNLIESNYNVFRYNIQGFSQGGSEWPGQWPEWYSWIRPVPKNWYETSSFWWKTIPTLSTEYKELDGQTVGFFSPTTPWVSTPNVLTFTNDMGTQRTEEIGKKGWNETVLNAYPLRKYYYFGLKKNRPTALDQLKDTLGNVQTI